MQQQSFTIPSDFFGSFFTLFINLVFLIVIAYLLILVLNFFRDKFINTDSPVKNQDHLELITILQKLFFVSGFGFVIANILQFMLSQMSGNRANVVQFVGDWDYLTFGIILIFVGMGFGAGKKLVLKDRKL